MSRRNALALCLSVIASLGTILTARAANDAPASVYVLPAVNGKNTSPVAMTDPASFNA